MISNPLPVPVPAGAQVHLNCVSNASYFQRVTLSWPNNSAVFAGTGENVPMKLNNGQTTLVFGPAEDDFDLSARFEYSTTGPAGPFHLASMSPLSVGRRGPFSIVWAASEDATDNDHNDSYLTVVMVEDSGDPPTSGAKREFRAASTAAYAQLELHAKTYYDHPEISTGDEHYITISKSLDSQGSPTISYSGMGWDLKNSSCWDEETTFGGYIHAWVKLQSHKTNAGMQNAVLILSCDESYWGSFPTGHRTVDWTAKMTNTTFHVTRVTP